MIRAGLVIAGLALASLAQAGVLDRVRASGVLRCGAAARAGFAEAGEDGRVAGLGVELCRALAVGVLGPGGRVAFRSYATDGDFEGVRAGEDDVAFLTGAEVRERGLAAGLVPGPVVFVTELTALAQAGVPGLENRTVCFMNGSVAQQALEAWAVRTRTPLVRSGFQEEGEMRDAFNARRCDAMAGERTELAGFRDASPGRAGAVLVTPFAVVPVRAATPAADGGWASLCGWALEAVVQSEQAPSAWRGDLPGTNVPGLRPGWEAEVAGVLGAYGDMAGRHGIGGDGMNAPWPEGVLLPPGPR